MKNKVKRILSVFMAVCMLTTMIPLTAYGEELDFADDVLVSAEAAEAGEETEIEIGDADTEFIEDVEIEEEQSETENVENNETSEEEIDTFSSGEAVALFSDEAGVEVLGNSIEGYQYSIVMVDCGRKYFSPDSLKSIIYSAATAGMHHVMLAIGNDGLRFLLDDMSVEANGQKYSSYEVASAIHKGNEKYSDFEVDELTERDMESVLAYAAQAGVEIIPLINSPGHMDAILNAANTVTGVTCSYSGSARTIDVTNSTATAFTQALLQKYITWFASKGCTMFNMGADEYANDVNKTPHFSDLIWSGKYSSYITYLNTVAGMIKNAGMTPMAFNDGIYYNQHTSSGTIDTDIVICYWSSGWNGYDVASASFLKNKGFKLVNTHGDWYWVLGKDKVTSEKASQFIPTSFMGSTIENPAGAMFCIWCDVPTEQSDSDVAANVDAVIKGFGTTLPTTEGRTVHSGVSVSEPIVKEIKTNAEISNVGESTILSMTNGEEVCWTTSDVNVISLSTDTGVSEVSVQAVSDSVIASNVKATAVGAGEATITANTAVGNTYTQTFQIAPAANGSNGDGSNGEDDGNNDTGITEEAITLEMGEEVSRTQENVNNAGNCDTSKYDGSVATVTVSGQDEVLASDTYKDTSVKLSTLAGNNSSYTKTQYYYYHEGDKAYYPVYAKKSGANFSTMYCYGYSKNNSEVTEIKSVIWWADESVTVYTKSTTTGAPASTTIAFKGLMPGTTYYTVGTTKYVITVKAIEKTESRTLYVNQSENLNIEVPDGVTVTYEVTEGTDLLTVDADGKVTANATVGTATVVAIAKMTNGNTYGTYTYNYSIVAEDLTKVDPLKIEYWITNAKLMNNDVDAYSLSATDAYGEEGVNLTFIPEKLPKDNREVYFWRCRLLDKTIVNTSKSGTEEQTGESGDDETTSGLGFTKARYYNGNWQVFSNNEWTTVEEKHQLIAYYLEKIDVCDEVTAYAADWGTIGDGQHSWGYPPEGTRGSLSVQVVYEDNTTNPKTTSAEDMKSKTIFYYVNGDRGIGTVLLNENSEYEIYKVTAETGNETSRTSGQYVTLTGLTLDNNEKTVWEGTSTEGQVSIHNESNGPNKTDPYDNLCWEKAGDAILLRVYVRAKVTEDSLSVHYIDSTDGSSRNEFYSYNIAVKSGTLFNTQFGWNTTNKELTGNKVENIKGVEQTIQSDLSKMTEISASYRYSSYECINAERSEDGKDVYIYYTFENSHSFVVDFGLPLEITESQLELNDVSWDGAEIKGAKYGTTEIVSSNGNDKIVYTPTSVLLGTENLTLTLKGVDDEGNQTFATHTISIYPASTVFYEEGFANVSGFAGASKGSGTQNTAVLGEDSNNYGYDGYYSNAASASNGTNASSSIMGDSATFTFSGTGVDVLANTTAASGYLTVKVTDANNTTKKLAIVSTAMKGDLKGADTGYGVPVYSVTDLPNGKYTVTIYHSMDANTVSLDGFRVYNTLQDSAVYAKDGESNPSFFEIRDLRLGTVDASKYGTDGRNVYAVGEQVYQNLTSEGAIDGVITVDGQVITEAELKNVLEKGPKNEVYLPANSTITFVLAETGNVQIGLKGVNGTASYTINGTAGTASSVDMFYSITGGQTVTIKNTGSSVLSLTKLKFCNAAASVQAISVESIVSALYTAGLKDPEPTPIPATPAPTAKPTAKPTATPTPTVKPEQSTLAAPKLGKVVSAGYNALKLNWSKVKGADGYRVYVKVNGKWKALGNVKGTSYVHKKLETGKSYTYTVRAYKKTKSGTVWSSYDKNGISGKPALNTPVLRKIKKVSSKKATLTWKKVSGASGYVVYRKTNNGKWKAIKKITKGSVTSYTDKKLSKGKKYTYTVRAYRKVGKKNVYSSYNAKGLSVK